MNGLVNANFEATLPLVLLDPGERSPQVETVIDTGFTEFLTLPPALIASLGLVWLGQEQGYLADGSVSVFDEYEAQILWDGFLRTVAIQAVDVEPLLGMNMLRGHEEKMVVVDGASVTIIPFP